MSSKRDLKCLQFDLLDFQEHPECPSLFDLIGASQDDQELADIMCSTSFPSLDSSWSSFHLEDDQDANNHLRGKCCYGHLTKI